MLQKCTTIKKAVSEKFTKLRVDKKIKFAKLLQHKNDKVRRLS